MTSRLVSLYQRMQGAVHGAGVAAVLAIVATVAASPTVFAQSPTNGRALYFTTLVPGKLSCSAGGCHTADLSRNLNHIGNASHRPEVIAAAIANVPTMNFLAGRLNSAQLADLAAYIGNPAGAGPLPVPELSATALDFGTVNLGTTSNLRLLAIRNIGTTALQLSNLLISNPEFSRPTLGTCGPNSVIPPQSSCTLALEFTPVEAGNRTAVLTIQHNGLTTTSTVQLRGVGQFAADSMLKTMVEYYHPALGYYFMTSRDSDVKLLDSRPEWTRTGLSFKVLRLPITKATGLVRFYFDRIARNYTRGTHFYTVDDGEREGLTALNPINAQLPGLPYYEGIDSYAFAPLQAGVGGFCAEGQLPVYRVFRGQVNFPDDPNHRFLTDVNLYNAHVAAGWDGEGVKICIPDGEPVLGAP